MTTGVGTGGLFAVGVALVLASIGFEGYRRQSTLVAATVVMPAVLNAAVVLFLMFPTFPRSFLYVLPFGLVLVVRGVIVFSRWLAARTVAMPDSQRLFERTLPLVLLTPVVEWWPSRR